MEEELTLLLAHLLRCFRLNICLHLEHLHLLVQQFKQMERTLTNRLIIKQLLLILNLKFKVSADVVDEGRRVVDALEREARLRRDIVRFLQHLYRLVLDVADDGEELFVAFARELFWHPMYSRFEPVTRRSELIHLDALNAF